MSVPKLNIHGALQTKAVVGLAIAVAATTLVGGWAYRRLVSQWVLQGQRDEAARLANALRMTAAEAMGRRDRPGLDRIAREFLYHDNVLHLSIVDDHQRELAGVSRSLAQPRWEHQDVSQPVGLAAIRPVGQDCLLVAVPVVDDSGEKKQVVGAVRLVLDSSAVAERLRRAHVTVLLLGCGMLVCAVTLGNVVVRRLLVLPIRKLARVTRKLAEGDLAARAKADRRDEIGALAESFSAMAEKIESQHHQLLTAKERLEVKVHQRTSQLRHANQRLRSDMAEREEFLRAVSHDLGAPLRNIAGMTAMLILKSRDVLPEQVLARLERIRANVDAEREMINELLDLSRIRTRPQRREWVDVGELLGKIRDSFEFDLRQRGIALGIAPDMPTLHVERGRLRQVFMNLVDNAVKYMPPRDDGRIEISCERIGDEHVFHVADNGTGVAEKDRDCIFTVFRRGADGSNVPGKGVGLATVKAIVAKYEGRLWVDGAPNAGATFHVALPLATTGPPAKAPDACDEDHQLQSVS